MEVALPYGTQTRMVTVPDDAVVVRSQPVAALADPRAAFDAAIAHPTGAPALAELVGPKDQVALVISDGTRPTPNHLLVPWLLKALEHIPREQIVILVGTGSHRAMTRAELVALLGDEVVETIAISNHDARDVASLSFLGSTAAGVPVWVNRQYLQAQVRIVIGFIEPHFFAGYSGGPKGVIPGLAGLATIQALHSAPLIDHPGSTWMALDENPIHQGICAAVALCPPEFLINVTLNPQHQITGIFAGHYLQAHRAGCDVLASTASDVEVGGFDVVVTTNAGYPLDQNLYQSVKGMTAAARLVRPGGAIVLVAECRDGLPTSSHYERLLQQATSPGQLLEHLQSSQETLPDQWQVQKQALVQQRARVFLHSSLPDALAEAALLTPAPDLQATVHQLVADMGSSGRLAVLPEGPMTAIQNNSGN
jgi:nickel-dependent lactate racemase